MKRPGAAGAEKLLDEGVDSLTIVRDQLLFAQEHKGVSAIPLAGGPTKSVLQTNAPISVLSANGFVYVTDRSLSNCRKDEVEGGRVCDYAGSAFRVKF